MSILADRQYTLNNYKQLEKSGIMLPVTQFSIQYLKPAFFDDQLIVSVKLSKAWLISKSTSCSNSIHSGINLGDLNIQNLITRLSNVDEVILAIPFTVEGEATSYFLNDILKKYNVKVSRPAKGLPAGASIEYVDQLTLQNSIEERTEIDD